MSVDREARCRRVEEAIESVRDAERDAERAASELLRAQEALAACEAELRSAVAELHAVVGP